MYKLIVFFTTFFLLQACITLIPKPYEMPAADILFIHKNPKAGDYAVYSVRNKSIAHRYEIFETTSKNTTVRYRLVYLDPDYKELAPKEWYFRLVDLNGKVLKAWAETDKGDHFTTPVAKINEIGSLEYLTHIKKGVVKPVVTTAGSFIVTDIYNYIYRADAGLIKTNSSCLEYHSESVPFKIVKREFVHSADVGAFLKASEFITAAGETYLSGNYLSLYNKATSGNDSYSSIFELIEYGFSKE